MFESIMNFLRKMTKKEDQTLKSKDAAKERLHLVLMQDRANVSADFLDLMKQEIIEVIKKYIDIDESAMDVRLTNKENNDGTNGAPALYANIPIVNIKDEVRKTAQVQEGSSKEQEKKENKKVKQAQPVEKNKNIGKEEKTKKNSKLENTKNEKQQTKTEEPKENRNEEAKNEETAEKTEEIKESKEESKN